MPRQARDRSEKRGVFCAGITNQKFTIQVPPRTEKAPRVLHTSWTGSVNIEFQSISVTTGDAWRAHEDEEIMVRGSVEVAGRGGEPFVILQAAELR